MLRGIGKFMLCAALTLALGGLVQTAWAGGCGCNKCAKKSCGCQRESCGSKCGSKSCGCNKCGKPSCNKCGKRACGCNSCGPRQWCADPGIGGYKLDLNCADACCIDKPCEQEVCVQGWDLCEKWCDGLVHHPYELVFNGHGNMCDYGPCEAFIPCARHGVICRTECGECGCPETTCEDITRPRTIPWWFNPGHGNTYLDENGNPVCGQTLPPKEAPPVAPPVEQPPVAPPVPPTPPAPAPPEPSEPPIVVDGRG